MTADASGTEELGPPALEVPDELDGFVPRPAENCPAGQLTSVQGYPTVCAPAPPATPAPTAPPDLPGCDEGNCFAELPCDEDELGWPTLEQLERDLGRPPTRVAYVSPDGSERGNGSREAPFRLIEQTHDTLADIVVLAAGTHPVEFQFLPDTSYVGACGMASRLSGTRLATRIPSTGTVNLARLRLDGILLVLQEGSALTLQNVVAQEPPVGAFVDVTGGSLVVDGLWVDGTSVETEYALFTLGAGVTSMRRVYVKNAAYHTMLLHQQAQVSLEDVHLDTADVVRTRSCAIIVMGTSQLSLRRVALTGLGGTGALCVPGEAQVYGGDVTIEGQREVDYAEAMPNALQVLAPATVSLEGVTIDGVVGYGVSNFGGRLTLNDLWIRNTRVHSEQTRTGFPLQMASGAHTTIERAVIESFEGIGLMALETNTHLTLRDTTVRDIQPAPDGTLGRALNVGLGATADLARVRVIGGGDVAVSLQGNRATTISDLDLVGSPGTSNDGLIAQDGESPTLERVRATDFQVGLGFISTTGTSTWSDLSNVSGADDQTTTQGKFFLATESAERLLVRRLHVRDGAHDAVALFRTDGTLEDTWVEGNGRTSGVMNEGGAVRLLRAWISRPSGAGVLNFGASSALVAEGLVVQDPVTAGPCGQNSRCYPAGCGVSTNAGSFRLERFWLDSSTMAGLCVSGSGNTTGADGLLSNNPVALLSSSLNLDLDRDFTRVRLQANARNVDLAEFPVPTPPLPPSRAE